ncbi:MAG: TonB-dependent receptor, partial [Alphaproteobacteria bacterium]|nr:TonB-dependent receptor [Alphaproteobacteria bacterium]
PTQREQIGTSVAVINALQLEQAQTVYAQDALKYIAGVAVYQSGGAGTTSNVFLRGLAGKYTSLVIDGIQVNNPVSQQAAWPHITVNGIERIEVLRGAQGVLYGSEAVGGVVNIYTRAGGEQRHAVRLEMGRFDTEQGEFSTSGDWGQLGYGLSVQHFKTKSISARADNDERDENENLSLVGRFTYPIGEYGKAEFALRTHNGETEFDGCAFGSSDDCHTDSDNQAGRLAFSWQRNKINHEFAYALSKATDDNFVNQGLTSTNEGERKTFDYRAIIAHNPNNQFVFGLQHENESYLSQTTTRAYYETNMQAAYIVWQGIWPNALEQDKLHISLAARHDSHDEADDYQTMRATLRWQVLPKLALRTAYGTARRVPSLFELNDPLYGNKNLRAEKSASFDMGFIYRVNDIIRVEVTAFDIKIDDLIGFHPQTFRSIQTTGQTTSEGIESALVWQIADATEFVANYTYTDVKEPSGARAIRRPRHIVNLSLTHDFNEKLNGTLTWHNARSILDTDFSTFPSKQVALDDYHLVKLGFNYMLTDAVRLYGRVENALNDDYQTVLSYNSPPRAAYMGVQFDF